MAQVARPAGLDGGIEDYLTYLLREWESVPELAAEWGEWEEHEKLDFAIEWPIREDRFQQLREWAAQGFLKPRQRERYERLLRLVEQHRPTLERLLAD